MHSVQGTILEQISTRKAEVDFTPLIKEIHSVHATSLNTFLCPVLTQLQTLQQILASQKEIIQGLQDSLPWVIAEDSTEARNENSTEVGITAGLDDNSIGARDE